MLVVDVEGQGRTGNVDAVLPIQLDGERVHLLQAGDGCFLQCLVVFKITAHVGVEAFEREGQIARHGLRVAREVEPDRASQAAFAVDGEINEAGSVVERACGMKRPLVALAEDVGDEFLRRAVIIGEKVVFLALGIGRIDVGHDLHVGAGEVPWEFAASGTDTELVFGQVGEFQSGLQCQTQRAETVFRIDAVTEQFSRPATGEDDIRAENDRETVGVVVVVAVEYQKSCRFFRCTTAVFQE